MIIFCLTQHKMFISRLTSFMFLYNRSLFLSRKPKCHKKTAVSQLKIKKRRFRCLSNRTWHCGFFYPQHSRWPPRHNARDGNLPSPESYVSFCQPVCVCSERGGERQWLYRPILILRLYRLTVGSRTRQQSAERLVLRRSFELHNIV